MTRSKILDRILFYGAAAFFLAVGLLMEIRVATHYAVNLRVPGFLCIAVGLAMAGAYFLPRGKIRGLLKTGVIMCANTAVLLGLIEAGCRVGGVDFNALMKVKERNEAFPVYYQMPAEPVGEVYFKRPGPMSWTGRPLADFLEKQRGTDTTYESEKVVTIRWDKDGFRNPEGLSDWEIAVVGDSFTESGYLEEPEIFTSVLARSLGSGVKNLGVSDTGNFTHSCYLQNFGKAASLRAGVLAFFEGNDLTDNLQEMRDLAKFRETGERPSREIVREGSLVRTVYRFVRDFQKVKLGERSYANADFIAGGGSVPITIADAPPAPGELGGEMLAALDQALDDWAATCTEVGAEPWLLYMPCKRRVFDGMVTLRENYPKPEWELNRLPEFIRVKCLERKIRFVDVTPALVARSGEGVMTFNAIYDTHLNAEGHRITGEVLAEAMRDVVPGGALVSVPAEVRK